MRLLRQGQCQPAEQESKQLPLTENATLVIVGAQLLVQWQRAAAWRQPLRLVQQRVCALGRAWLCTEANSSKLLVNSTQAVMVVVQ